MQQTTEMLIAANADLNTVDVDGENALLMALGQATTSDNNNVTYHVPVCVCIRPRGRWETKFAQDWVEPCDGRFRPHDCRLQL